VPVLTVLSKLVADGSLYEMGTHTHRELKLIREERARGVYFFGCCC